MQPTNPSSGAIPPLVAFARKVKPYNDLATSRPDRYLLGLVRVLLQDTSTVARMPVTVVVELGAILTLFAWQANGLTVDADAGLPDATEALGRWFVVILGHRRHYMNFVPTLAIKMAALRQQRFAHQARAHLHADLVLGDADEDTLVDSMARFLWANRHTLPKAAQGENP